MRRPFLFREIIYTDASNTTVSIARFVWLRTPLLSVYSHRILAPDDARADPHDHPRSFYSWLRRGGYVEYYWPDPRNAAQVAMRRFNPTIARWHKFERGAAHRIISVLPGTRTVCVFYGRRNKAGWGFFVNGEFVHHTDYSEASS